MMNVRLKGSHRICDTESRGLDDEHVLKGPNMFL